jgi:hypothetical protein
MIGVSRDIQCRTTGVICESTAIFGDPCRLRLHRHNLQLGQIPDRRHGDGLHGSGLVLENNSGDSLTITANGSFTFTNGVKNNDAYSVTVATEPSDPVQTCTVHNGSGTIDKAAITNVVVTCVQAGASPLSRIKRPTPYRPSPSIRPAAC